MKVLQTAGMMMLVLVMVMVLLMGCGGCASRGKVDQLLAATQEQAKRAATTEAVMLELAKRGSTVIPDTIATVEPGSMVGWAQATRCIRDETNKPLLDKDGKAQLETTTAIGKCKSDRAFGALTTGTIKLAGVGFDLKDGKLIPSSILEGAVVHVESNGGDSTLDAAHAKVWGDAIAAEKGVILAGMANLATQRGAAFAVKVEALSGGMANVVTATGAVLAQVLKTTAVPIPTDLVAAGITKIVTAVTRTKDGQLVDILAADSAAAQNASAALAAEAAPAAGK